MNHKNAETIIASIIGSAILLVLLTFFGAWLTPSWPFILKPWVGLVCFIIGAAPAGVCFALLYFTWSTAKKLYQSIQ